MFLKDIKANIKNSLVIEMLKNGFKLKPMLSIIWIILMLISSILPSFEIIYLSNLTTLITNHAEINQVLKIIVLFIFFSIFAPSFLNNLQGILQSIIFDYLDKQITEPILKKATTINLPILENAKTYNKLSRVSSYSAEGIINLMSITIRNIRSIIQAISLIVALGWISPILLVNAFVIALPISFVRRKLNKNAILFNRKLVEKKRWCSNLLNILFEKKNAVELWINNDRKHIKKIWIKKQESLDNEECTFTKKQCIWGDLICILNSFGTTYAYITIAWFLYKGFIKSSLAISCLYALGRFFGIANSITNSFNTMAKEKIKYEEYKDVILWKDETSTTKNTSLQNFINISCKNVSYCYNNSNKVALNNISLDIKNGEKIVLVGENGSGKSTLIRLLLGLDKPSAGNIYIDGYEISEVIESLREKTSVMFQDYFKYDISIKDNITLSDSVNQNNSNHFNYVVTWSEIYEFINKLPKGFDTKVYGGGTLSGGEWQKIALARAKFRERSFIVLDEPNSAVDAFYETKLYKQFFDLTKDSTTIIVSHRLPICQLADKIIVMNNGNIVEAGTHQQLINKQNGHYRNMFESQAALYAN